MRVLLSIKPEFAFKIFDGSKKFEFRKVIFKKPDIKSIVVYASSPVKKVIGEFEIDCILNADLNTLWKETQEFSGITEDYFLKYFNQREEGYAIKVKTFKKYKKPLCIKEDFQSFPPQSFIYLT
ncbi:ASCH domain-containing protein [Pontibacter saemangeumensis]|uniref:ASCH domain-containing protein n=1 Tax=Pontibacter saemangeumensis TaxID=1084525 RepID=A0ABP8M7L6_9BACT